MCSCFLVSEADLSHIIYDVFVSKSKLKQDKTIAYFIFCGYEAQNSRWFGAVPFSACEGQNPRRYYLVLFL